MATVIIELSGGNVGYPLPEKNARSIESITSSGTSQVTTIEARDGEMVSIHSDGALWVYISASPTAAADTGRYISGSGQRYDFGPLKAGDKVAVIDA